MGSQIRDTFVSSSFHGRPCGFSPEGCLKSLISETFVNGVLKLHRKTPDDDEKAVVNFVLTKASKLLAILMLSSIKGKKLYQILKILMDKNVHDSGLPIQKTVLDHFEGLEYDDEPMLDDIEIHNICEHQWEFCSPVFSSQQENHDIDARAILPFTERPFTKAEGGFGQVWKYEIHQSHIDTTGLMPLPQYVAVKKIVFQSNQISPQVSISDWEKEVGALWKMRKLKQKHIVRFITAFRRYDEKHPVHDKYYLILEWADGGNLINLWESKEFCQSLTGDLVKDALEQMRGLSEALNQVHNPEIPQSGEHFRHGDLKPENILWFKDPTGKGIGTLKIGDWGLAKEHQDITQLRTKKTSTEFGTLRYEPPEETTVNNNSLVVPNPQSRQGKIGRKRSRLYDVWAIGCIWLEFLVWLMYGHDGLRSFRNQFPRFYDVNKGDVAIVHRVAEKWMDHMFQDPVCKPGQTALGDLLELIKTQLLVVRLPDSFGSTRDLSSQPGAKRTKKITKRLLESVPPLEIHPSSGSIPQINEVPPDPVDDFALKRPSSTRGVRVRSDQLLRQMELICCDQESHYWFTGNPLSAPDSNVKGRGNTREPQSGQPLKNPNGGLLAVKSDTLALTGRLDEDWKHIIDNDFATSVLSSLKEKGLSMAGVPESSTLCSKCQPFRDSLWQLGFNISYDWSYLQANSIGGICDLCALLSGFRKKVDISKGPVVRFTRDGSTILMNGYTSVASLFRSPDLGTGISNHIQIGLPDFPSAGRSAYLEIIRQWLKACDNSHKSCAREQSRNSSSSLGANKKLPTRVIDVGLNGDRSVKLLKTTSNHKGEWVALSHQWGEGAQFRTLTQNLKDYEAGISIDHLAATFRDAVIVTRAIGCRYLWVDSLCIIQGPDGDFDEQAKQMEQVYSGAYCVLAASRSPGHYAGFLGPRIERKGVTLRREGNVAPFYLREAMDDFQAHVLEGPLSGRGWVLQEHALARRTIYFTDFQTYFECGDGIRCESMSKITNQRSTFLGDPDFPRLMTLADRGIKILGYQNIYKLYSGLGLSVPTDRPWAINGLQERLLKTLNLQGGYGVFFQDQKNGHQRGFFRRSLLWRRAEKESSLPRIPFKEGSSDPKIPSWSWMAYSGSIDYIPADFGETEWMSLQSQWGTGRDKCSNGVLVAEARDYTVDDKDSMPVFDSPSDSEKATSKCVVLGRQRDQPEPVKVHYVLLVQPKSPSSQIYQRVGAGTLPGRCIEGNGVKIHIH
ncbi:HET-domain-containing protein [Fusarium austroafricanum]|uniref:HET-domain-containing protein n=1 Tax=Fusarium austroafricanum TaxID=2364996 RepID=A0A8H4P3X5_9HYPO|nr:HET-domain-containing protein [Fusarium austroafricanum]